MHFSGPDRVSAASAYYVSPSGSDSNPGTLAQPWQHINYAVSRLSPGDTLYVRGGTYSEKVTINVSGSAGSPITVQNYNGETPIISGSGVTLGWEGLINIVGASYVVIDGLEVVDASSFGIFVRNALSGGVAVPCDHLTIRNCTTRRTARSGIGAQGNYPDIDQVGHRNVTNMTVTGNTVVDPNSAVSWEAISLQSVGFFEVSYNEIYATDSESYSKEGIDIKGGSWHGSVHHNYLHDFCGPGVYLDAGVGGVHDVDVYANLMHDLTGRASIGYYWAGVGVQLAAEKVNWGLDDISVHDNVVGPNTYAGISFGNTAAYHGSGRYFRNIRIANNTLHAGVGRLYSDGTYAGFGHSLIFSIYAGYESELTGIVIRNNIFCGDTGGKGIRVLEGGSPANVECNVDHNLFQTQSDYYGTDYVGPGADPGFVGIPGTDPSAYQLRADSPAIDAGSSVGAPSTDYAGTARPQGSGYDIGAYEYVPSVSNDPPVLDPVGDRSVNEGELLEFTVSASDPDGDPLTYLASNLPSGATFDPQTRTFSWRPNYAQGGIYTGVHLEVTDGALTASEEIVITVNKPFEDWDPNADGVVNALDLTVVGQHWDESGDAGWIREDVNEDGTVNSLDMLVIGQHWTT